MKAKLLIFSLLALIVGLWSFWPGPAPRMRVVYVQVDETHYIAAKFDVLYGLDPTYVATLYHPDTGDTLLSEPVATLWQRAVDTLWVPVDTEVWGFERIDTQ